MRSPIIHYKIRSICNNQIDFSFLRKIFQASPKLKEILLMWKTKVFFTVHNNVQFEKTSRFEENKLDLDGNKLFQLDLTLCGFILFLNPADPTLQHRFNLTSMYRNLHDS